jgi:predicted HicB family RNase H-like nuclease
MTIMHYGNYEAQVDYDEDAELFHGEITNLRDVVTFQGRSVAELKQAIADSVEDYLDFCRERGEAPEEPWTGELQLSIAPRLHQAIASAAKRSGVTLERWVARTLEQRAALESSLQVNQVPPVQAVHERTS